MVFFLDLMPIKERVDNRSLAETMISDFTEDLRESKNQILMNVGEVVLLNLSRDSPVMHVCTQRVPSRWS
jgi:hypothetical protein